MNRLKRLALRLLQAEGAREDSELSVVLTTDEHISELNLHYRDMDEATDVLSFSQLEGDDTPLGDYEEGLLGDIVISVETAKRQARAAKKTTQQEVEMLLTHGVLHLLGYDHAEDSDSERMFARQTELLSVGDEA